MHSREEGKTASLPPQEVEKVWHGPSNPQVLQLWPLFFRLHAHHGVLGLFPGEQYIIHVGLVKLVKGKKKDSARL